ncbi:MAG: hypothetical protein J0L75_07730 [Spirochaetes bacterium]|nr:hypothetical protein [Spirochaetota bacterium]
MAEGALREFFARRFPDGKPPRLFGAPGRVTLLGEHIIHGGGIVLSTATPQQTRCAAAPGKSGRLRVGHAGQEEQVDLPFPPTEEALRAAPAWAAKAVGWMLDLGVKEPDGLDLAFETDIAANVGLSRAETHAAAAMAAVEGLNGVAWPKENLDPCFLDQNQAVHPWRLRRESVLGIRYAKAGEALLVDPLLLRERSFPFTSERYRLLLLDSRVPQQRAEEVHAERLATCAKALRKIQTRFPKCKRLADLALDELESSNDILGDVEFKRVRHIITEVARVKQGVLKLKQLDFFSLGRLMLDSHVSLKNDYNVTCFESDLLVGFAKSLPGALGIKMTGLGLGGYLLALVERTMEASAVEKMKEFYLRETDKELGVVPLEPSGGPGELGE